MEHDDDDAASHDDPGRPARRRLRGDRLPVRRSGDGRADIGQNAIVRFDPATETFDSFPSDRSNAAVRQMLGRPGEVWGAESGLDRLVVIRTIYVVPA